MGFRILAINPGATSTKIAIFEDERPLFKKTVPHSMEDLRGYPRVMDQIPYRRDLILAALAEAGIALGDLSAVVGRGGLLRSIPGGTYRVNETMVGDMKSAARGEHASNLGAVLAKDLGDRAGIPSFIVDPVSVDEMDPVARISGSPEVERISMFHALNHKAVAHRVAAELGRPYEDLNLVVAHLGSGVSVAAHRRGRVVDVNDAKQEGPFSPERAGGLPAYDLVALCYSGRYTFDEMKKNLMSRWGMAAYLGTKDLQEVEARARGGDEKAALLLDAFAYQLAKEIGAQATVLEGKVDRVVLTGGMAHSKELMAKVIARVSFIAPVAVVPGEEELEALALGALRVLRGEEAAKDY